MFTRLVDAEVVNTHFRVQVHAHHAQQDSLAMELIIQQCVVLDLHMQVVVLQAARLVKVAMLHLYLLKPTVLHPHLWPGLALHTSAKLAQMAMTAVLPHSILPQPGALLVSTGMEATAKVAVQATIAHLQLTALKQPVPKELTKLPEAKLPVTSAQLVALAMRTQRLQASQHATLELVSTLQKVFGTVYNVTLAMIALAMLQYPVLPVTITMETH